jgi:hypothetical protein
MFRRRRAAVLLSPTSRIFLCIVTRIDRMGPDRFYICWMRRTGKGRRLYIGVTLAEELGILETEKSCIRSDRTGPRLRPRFTAMVAP